MMRKKGWIILMSAALVFLLSAPGWAAFTTECIPGLEIGGYIRNQTDIRAASPQDIMRMDTNAAVRFDYKPTTFLQFYLELRPFVDAAPDLSSGLTRHNRGIMHIDSGNYAWRASGPHAIGQYGFDTEVGGHVSEKDVLSTNMNNSYWLRNTFLREAWMLYKNPCWQVKAGKQIVTWGETDGLKLLDFVNATDYRHFIIDDMEDSKIPEWMMNITYFFNPDYNLQFLWIPEYVQNFQAPAGSAWALDGVNLIYMYDHFDALNLQNGTQLPIADYFTRHMIAKNACTIDYNHPDNENEFGLRFKGVIGTNTDYTLNWFYTHQKNNVFIRNHWRNSPWLSDPILGSGGTDVFQFYTKPSIQRIYGGSFNHVFGNFLGLMKDLVMRGEMAYYYKTDFFGTYNKFNYFPANFGGDIGSARYGDSPGGDLFITKRDLIRGCLGFDKNVWWLGLNWLMSAQVFWEHILGYPDSFHGRDAYISNVGLTRAKQDEFTWTFYTNTDIMNERIKFDNLFVWNSTKMDGWNRFKVGFDISDHWSLWVGNNFFWGSDHSDEINPYVGDGRWFPGGPRGPYNPDAVSIGNIRRGDPIGEMSRNTSFFSELKYSF